MNIKLTKYAKIKRQLQLLDNCSDEYNKICSDASKVRVQKNLYKADTRIV